MKPLAILGPTACGKSDLAMKAALHWSGEIINCDSVQIYHGFDIGSAKPSCDDRAQVPHHLFDVVSGNDAFDAGMYAKLAKGVVAEVLARGKLPIIVGGTGLYFRALCGVDFHADLPADPDLRKRLAAMSSERVRNLLLRLDTRRAEELHPNDRYRNERALELRLLRGAPMATVKREPTDPGIDPVVVVIEPPRAWLRDRIRARTDAMFDRGLVDEVDGLLKLGISARAKPMQSIGYKEATAYLQGDCSLEAAREAAFVATCQYAKRQGTWFRKLPRAVTIASGEDWPAVEAYLTLNETSLSLRSTP